MDVDADLGVMHLQGKEHQALSVAMDSKSLQKEPTLLTS